MFSSAVPIPLKDKQKLRGRPGADAVVSTPAETADVPRVRVGSFNDFLRIPPFPGARVQSFSELRATRSESANLSDQVRRLRVGGTFWGAQPTLPANYVLVRSAAAIDAAASVNSGTGILLWDSEATAPLARHRGRVVTGECDPWHMLSRASALVAQHNDELRIIARLKGIDCYLFDPATGKIELDRVEPDALLDEALPAGAIENPFTREPMSHCETVELCGFWRRLIDSNRAIKAGLGFAFWKQGHVAPLLWNGQRGPFNFVSSAANISGCSEVALWRTKTSQSAIAILRDRAVKLVEVEDGFLRSRGLGADCVPPLSITVDRVGAHFDPSSESELENLLQNGAFNEALLARARGLRHVIVEAGLGKYERGAAPLDRPAGDVRHILVPGQVEDDRAVQAGGCGLVSNLDLLKKVREQAADAHIIYKPHPDVVAGHRRGAIREEHCLRYADQILADAPIASLLDMVDEVHVNTSLAGFEALLRGKPVTTYGVPFYAGWGLTRDLGPIPSRRTTSRTIDELVVAALLIYPRYLDPVTGLPCPPEIVVQRLNSEWVEPESMVVGIRRLQGRLKRGFRGLRQ